MNAVRRVSHRENVKKSDGPIKVELAANWTMQILVYPIGGRREASRRFGLGSGQSDPRQRRSLAWAK